MQFLDEGTAVDSVTRKLGQMANDVDIDLEVAAPVQWLLGQNAAHSTFGDTDKLVTICFREGTEWDYCRHSSREYTPADDTDAPRLVITHNLIDGDANYDGCVDGLDHNQWSLNCLQAGGWGEGNFNGDALVDGLDYNILGGIAADNESGGVSGSRPAPNRVYWCGRAGVAAGEDLA